MSEAKKDTTSNMTTSDDKSKELSISGMKQDTQKRYAPDFGTAHVPGAGDIRHAPKSLDHFKRGHQERAAQREKEFYAVRGRNDGRGRPHHSAPSRHTNDPWIQRDRPTILQGLDINLLADSLTKKLNNKDAVFQELSTARRNNPDIFELGKAMTALISVAARRKNIGLGRAVWDWMDHAEMPKNTFHYNSMISVAEKARNHHRALELLKEMTERKVEKNEVTFSSAISACEKCGQWKVAIDLLNSMEREGVARTAIAYNAAISACEKGMVPQKACEVFQRMKREGINPSVVSYSALISAAEKGGQWKLALEILEEMKSEGFFGNVVAYSACISALAKGQQWRKALQLFREIQAQGSTPSIVTYNATMNALEKGMQWERALDLFEEMKMNNLPITVVSYGSAISACDKGFQYRQCLEFLDEMTEMGISKNVIIFGAAMSCMEKCSRATICFQLMTRMKEEGIAPNVHIYNSAISACARSNLWEKGYSLYKEMEKVGVCRDVVTYNAILDAVCSQITLGRELFEVGVEKGFYAKVSRLGEQWFELDLHFLSLGGGEIALGWWFEVCLVPYLKDLEKLDKVNSISIVTGYGKTRTRGRRHGDDGMRKRCKAMLRFMNIVENDQSNLGRISVDKDVLVAEVKRNGGKIAFDLEGYLHWKETETTANVIPDTQQKIRARFQPVNPGSGRPPFTRVENETTTEENRLVNQQHRLVNGRFVDDCGDGNNDYSANVDYAVRDNIRFQGLGNGRGNNDRWQGDRRRGAHSGDRFNRIRDRHPQRGPDDFGPRDRDREHVQRENQRRCDHYGREEPNHGPSSGRNEGPTANGRHANNDGQGRWSDDRRRELQGSWNDQHHRHDGRDHHGRQSNGSGRPRNEINSHSHGRAAHNNDNQNYDSCNRRYGHSQNRDGPNGRREYSGGPMRHQDRALEDHRGQSNQFDGRLNGDLRRFVPDERSNRLGIQSDLRGDRRGNHTTGDRSSNERNDANDRKRHHDDPPYGGRNTRHDHAHDNNDMESKSSSAGNRGYKLEPDTQRRRLN